MTLRQNAGILEKRALRAIKIRMQHYNRTRHPLPALHISDNVVIQHHRSKRWTTPGVIVEVGAFRDYLVKTPAGRLFRRNPRFLRLHSPTVVPHSLSPASIGFHPPVSSSSPMTAAPPIHVAPADTSPAGPRRKMRLAAKKPVWNVIR
ncbi:hypothetical protein DAPPUDRAFT_247718 [Daphnia pulex]|uniref:Uncharacterized protein n=1 Tax=Daphnia pulex TaxID=6669 RepID=E9GT94_DAPPU|nr:hypothetical protein DAPPUDRAFT_247718 [Daphnia pulex]|eukprot:EFX77396.1 hypothetical protein DAPPUDRAFT_247718 [Daphnia pulex]